MPMSTLLAEKNKNKFLLLILLLALAVRLWVFPVVFSNGGVTLLGADTYYHARRILATVAHFPGTLSFDSYIDFPYGSSIGWPLLYDVFIALIALVIGFGDPSVYTIEATTAVVPLVLGVLTVVLVFLIAEKLFDWRIGLISAGIFAITPAHVYVSFLGYADHHVAETLLSTAAYLFFIIAMKRLQENNISFSNFRVNILKNSLFPALTGIMLALSIFTWDGAPIFIGLIGIYIPIQFVFDRKSGRSSDYLVITGGVAFLVSLLIISPVAASQGQGFEIYSYLPSMFHVGFLTVFFLLCILLGIMQKLEFKKWWYHPILLLLIFAAAASSLEIFYPQFYQSAANGISYLFGGGILATIQEAVPLFINPGRGFTLSYVYVWYAFTFSFFIVLLAFIHFIKKTIRDKCPPEAVFLIVWTLIVLILTILQRRFIYLLAVNIAIFSAYFIITTLKLFLPEKRAIISEKKRKSKKIPESISNTGLIIVLLLIALLAVHNAVAIKSISSESILASDSLLAINLAVLSICFIITALKLFSPENTGLIVGLSIIALLAVSNLTVISYMATEGITAPDQDLRDSFKWLRDNSPHTSYYDSPNKPAEYGVMSWWDYGNWILYISQRPVVANNFQTGIDDAAHFLTEPDEKAANDILNKRKVRFIVTDAQMLKLKFSSIALLAGKRPNDYYGNSEGAPIFSVNAENKKFFATMLSRLHVFDGDGLSHYRLIYESKTTAIKSPDIKYVKIFEYVPGATISGKASDGEIKITLNIMTNQGRVFVYTQRATARNGRYEITVPYSTRGGKYGTKPLSDYILQNANTATPVSINEQDLQEGRRLEIDLI